VWREQGLGDEILFATCLKDLEKDSGKVIVECDRRLVETWSRSFPNFDFRLEAYYNDPQLTSFHNDFDLHIPIGSLCGIYRKELTAFEKSGPFVVVDPEKKQKFNDRLNEAAKGTQRPLRVGLCWRSGMIAPSRNSGYTAFEDWGPILETPGIQFVNLQYGKCEEELCAVEEKFGISIVRWPDLSLQSDLDDVFALMACLDTVVTVETAVNTMSAAVGLPVMTITPYLGGWPNFGTKRYPFFPNVTCYFGEPSGVATTLPQIADVLAKKIETLKG
jgi:hypothetical protein